MTPDFFRNYLSINLKTFHTILGIDNSDSVIMDNFCVYGTQLDYMNLEKKSEIEEGKAFITSSFAYSTICAPYKEDEESNSVYQELKKGLFNQLKLGLGIESKTTELGIYSGTWSNPIGITGVFFKYTDIERKSFLYFGLHDFKEEEKKGAFAFEKEFNVSDREYKLRFELSNDTVEDKTRFVSLGLESISSENFCYDYSLFFNKVISESIENSCWVSAAGHRSFENFLGKTEITLLGSKSLSGSDRHRNTISVELRQKILDTDVHLLTKVNFRNTAEKMMYLHNTIFGVEVENFVSGIGLGFFSSYKVGRGFEPQFGVFFHS